jgi:hypothetical protein
LVFGERRGAGERFQDGLKDPLIGNKLFSDLGTGGSIVAIPNSYSPNNANLRVPGSLGTVTPAGSISRAIQEGQNCKDPAYR